MPWHVAGTNLSTHSISILVPSGTFSLIFPGFFSWNSKDLLLRRVIRSPQSRNQPSTTSFSPKILDNGGGIGKLNNSDVTHCHLPSGFCSTMPITEISIFPKYPRLPFFVQDLPAGRKGSMGNVAGILPCTQVCLLPCPDSRRS